MMVPAFPGGITVNLPFTGVCVLLAAVSFIINRTRWSGLLMALFLVTYDSARTRSGFSDPTMMQVAMRNAARDAGLSERH